jgi:hypothetical protein
MFVFKVLDDLVKVAAGGLTIAAAGFMLTIMVSALFVLPNSKECTTEYLRGEYVEVCR